jgi:glycerol kinase
MKTVQMFKTYDGQIFTTKSKALQHLNDLYYKLISKLSYDLDGIKFSTGQLHDYLDENLSLFKQMMDIKADMNEMEEEEN